VTNKKSIPRSLVRKRGCVLRWPRAAADRHRACAGCVSRQLPSSPQEDVLPVLHSVSQEREDQAEIIDDFFLDESGFRIAGRALGANPERRHGVRLYTAKPRDRLEPANHVGKRRERSAGAMCTVRGSIACKKRCKPTPARASIATSAGQETTKVGPVKMTNQATEGEVSPAARERE
jgi:hypothetical protein